MQTMPATKQILAFDLGAESGRALVGKFDGQKLGLDVVHRFPNGAVQTLDTLHWDVLRLYGEMVAGLRKAHAEHGELASMGVDTWGVDFALLGRDGTLLGNPRHYRDPHTETIMDAAFAKVPRAEVFRQTGIQFMRFNSLVQILALMRDRSPLLDVAESMLFIPISSISGSPASRSMNTPTPAPVRCSIPPSARGRANSSARSAFRKRCSARSFSRAPCFGRCAPASPTRRA